MRCLVLLAALSPLATSCAAAACDKSAAPHAPPTAVASANLPDAPQPRPLASAQPVPIPDVGIYADLDPRVRLQTPSWLCPGSCDVVATPFVALLTVHHIPVGFAASGAPASRNVGDVSASDADRDGIPDQLDILLGAKKAVLAAAPYRETYRQLPYPGGDMPRDEGVCTDVVIRALRNAGIDLQKLVHDDAAASRPSYPGIQRLDPNIDHRRVRNLVPWFKRHWTSLPADPADSSDPWLPGDIVFLDTMRDPQPDHLGVVSDTLGPSGRPLIINSWTTGYATAEMDLLAFVKPTHRFRIPTSALPP